MGLPWETLIKYYRNNILPSTGFDTLNGYTNNFIQSLNSKYINFLSYAELEYVVSFASSLFHNIFYTITQEIGRLIANGQELTDKKIHGLCNEVLSEYFDRYKKLNKVLNINDSRLVLNKYKKAIEQVRNAVFKKLGLPSELHKKIIDIMVYGFARDFIENVSSGIVVAGFGHNEFIPEVVSFKIEGIVWVERNSESKEILKYSFISDQSTQDSTSHVIAFAQADMVQRFMNGVDNYYRYAEESFVKGLCDNFVREVVSELKKYSDEEKEVIKKELIKYSDQVVREFALNMDKLVERYFSLPIVQAVGRLPKNELALMAEALVHLTSLKRKISEDPETVADPIDVAVITKGDGFIWVKRKHYFQANLNINYFMKRFQELLNETDTSRE